MRHHLFTPGPTPIPEEVARALAQPILHHRQEPFKEIFRKVSENLKYVFHTNADVLTLTSSGTGAMEAAVTNLLSQYDSALYVNGGKFGERWGDILRKYGLSPIEIKIEWGKAVQAEMLEEYLKKCPETKAVFLTHSETSTGTAIDLKRIAETIRKCSDALIVVDGISSVGGLELRMDEWGLDVVLTGSQKGLMLPPGLAFIALSDRAWRAVGSSTLPKFYFDLQKARKALAGAQTPWTPAISLIVGLDLVLEMIRNEGIENVWSRHARLAQALRQGSAALGLRTFSESPSNSVTALSVPESIDAEALRSVLRKKHGVIVAGGQDHLKGKVIRVAHLGYFNELDIIIAISALGLALKECLNVSSAHCDSFDPTIGVQAAMEELRTGSR